MRFFAGYRMTKKTNIILLSA